MAWGVPLVGVNHLEAHLFASLLEQPDLGWPLVVLLVSGGHTLLIEVSAPGRVPAARGHHRRRRRRGLRQGGPVPRPRLPGRPGHRPRSPAEGDPAAFAFPRSLPGDGYDFSFSGLKTSVVNTVRKQPGGRHRRRGRLVPGGGGRRAGRPGPAGPPPTSGATAALPGRRGGGQLAAPGPDRGGLRRGRHRGVPAQPGPVHRQRRHGGGGRAGGGSPRRAAAGSTWAPTRTCRLVPPSDPADRRSPAVPGQAGPARLGWHSARGCQPAAGRLSLALSTLDC